MASYADILFGRIVVKNGIAPRDRVAECLRRKPTSVGLGEALVKGRIISPEQAHKVQRAQALMQFMRAERTFARIVHEQRLVDMPTLRRCFKQQEEERHRVRLGQILMNRGLLTPEQNEAIVDRQLVLLAEETARIEEEGLSPATESASYRPTDDLAKINAAEDLDNSTMKKAVGPRGLFNAPSSDLVRRTLPMMKAAKIEDDPPPLGLSDSRSPPAAGVADGEGLVGKTIASRYRILSKVGEGGMGTVYQAEHCLMEKIVALKVLHPNLVSSSTSLERFRLEIRAASRFQHKNVVQIYDAGEGEGGIFYMAMEFAEGETLEDVIQRKGALPTDRVLSYLRQALRAVGEAHKKGIVHRDLKSGNLMITRDKNGAPLLKVMDFGIAKIAFDEQEARGQGSDLYHTQEGIVTGTPQYMSPEQASGETVDHRSDLYSLGVILFEMLTGELPFKSNTPMGFLGKHIVEPPPRPGQVKPGIPAVLEDVTLKLLEKKPDDRYRSAEKVLEDLDTRCSAEGLAVISSSAPAIAPPPQSLSAPPSAALTVQVPAPLGSTEIPARDLAPASGEESEEKKSPTMLIVGLVVLLLLVATGSTTLAIVLSRESDPNVKGPDHSLGRARDLLNDGDPAGAVAILEDLAREDPVPPEVQDLLKAAHKAMAEDELAADLVKKADELTRQFQDGAAGEQAAREAIQRYEHALSIREDPAVRKRLDALKARLDSSGDAGETNHAREGMALVLKANEAIQAGKLDDAAGLLRKAEMLLPASDEALARLRDYLKAAELVALAKRARADGDLQAARRDLRAAEALHPDAQVRSWISSELKSIEAELAQAERLAAITQLLDRSQAKAVELDLPKAKALLDEAAKTAASLKVDLPQLASRRKALNLLEGVARDLAQARKRFEAMESAQRGLRPQDVEAVLDAFDGLAPRIKDIEPHDAVVAKAVFARLAKLSARTAKLQKDVEAQREASKSDRLKRFERRLERLRKLPDERETRELIEARLAKFLDLQEAYSYVHGECSPEDKAWVDAQAKGYLDRRTLWRDLEPKEGPSAGMVQIPGGPWTSPAGTSHELPKVYYLGAGEVTCADWDRYLKATGREAPTSFPGPVDEPVRFVPLRDAKRYCRWLSKRPDGSRRRVTFRVPTEIEWERAVRGEGKDDYPWGADFADWRQGYAAVSGRVTRAAQFDKDRTPWGLFDVVGNVSEITLREGSRTQVVLKGGSAISERANCGFGWRREVEAGNEATAYVGLRLLAVER